MADRSFWYHVRTGKEVPVLPSEDLCLPLFDKPKLFGLHEEMLDEAVEDYPESRDRVLTWLALKNGWVLVDGAHNRFSCKVIAPSECRARSAVRRLLCHSTPSFLRVEVENERLDSRTTFEIHDRTIDRFVEGAPLHTLTG